MNDQSDDIEKIRTWLEENERTLAWLARQTGWSREMLSYVMNGHRPLSKKLASAISDKTGIALKGPERAGRSIKKEEQESELLAAAL